MQFQYIKIITSILLLLASNIAKADDCINNDINLSKSEISVGDLFIGKALSIYGFACDNQRYSIVVHLDDTNYVIKKAEKNHLGVISFSSKEDKLKYYGYLSIQGDKAYKEFLQYPENVILNEYLGKSKLRYINKKTINIKSNGIFKEKIYIPKTARGGKYITEFYVFNQNGEIISLHINSFNVTLNGNGGIIKYMMQHSKMLYIIISLITVTAISFFVTFSMDISKRIFKNE